MVGFLPNWQLGHRLRPMSQLCFPVGCAAVLTNIVWEQLDRAGLARLFPPGTVLCRDELENLASAESSVVVRRLRQFFPVDFPFATLTDDRLKTAHGVIHPEVVIRARPVTPASLPPDHPPTPEARVLEVLDRRQELVVRRLSHGHHVIAGVAGSGKTVLLLARARLLAARDPARRILVLCYNRTLATWLRSQLAEPPASQTAETASFREWAERLTGLAWDRGSESFEGYEERLGRAALAAAAALPDPEKYDAVLIDEGQDFQPDWLRAACHALKGGAAGDLMIAVDGAQSVYGRPKSFTWKSVGVEAVGRSQTLSKNYRNTKQIIELAWDVTQATAPRGAEHEPHLRVRPTHAVRRGPVPSYLACAGWAEECDRVAAVVRDWMFRTLRPEQIGVLYRRREGRRIEHLYDALRGCGPVCWVTSAADPSTRDRFTDRPGVRLITIHSAKGLQFSGVILAAVDQFPNPFQNDEEADRNLLYVGMTRAEECLILTWCGSTPFTERIRHSPKVAPYT